MKLSERAQTLVARTEAYLRVLNEFETGSEEKALQALRRVACEDVDRAVKGVMKSVAKHREDIENHPTIYKGQEVCVYGALTKSGYLLSADKMKKESGIYVALIMSENNAIYMSLRKFENIVADLRELILEGRLDNRVHLQAERLIYDRMRRGSSAPEPSPS